MDDKFVFYTVTYTALIEYLCDKSLLTTWCDHMNSLYFKFSLLSSTLSHVSHREVYSQFLKEMIIQPGIAKANLGLSREDVTMEDHVSPVSFVLCSFLTAVLNWNEARFSEATCYMK